MSTTTTKDGRQNVTRRLGQNGAQTPSAVRDRLQAPDGQSDVHYQVSNYRYLCVAYLILIR